MKNLTKAEEQLMQYVWKLEKGFLKDIINKFPDPKPAYTTVATVIGILVKKGFIGFNQYGKVREYFPVVSKRQYSSSQFKRIIHDYFNNSVEQFSSFFTDDTDLSITQLEELKKSIEQQINIKKKKDLK